MCKEKGGRWGGYNLGGAWKHCTSNTALFKTSGWPKARACSTGRARTRGACRCAGFAATLKGLEGLSFLEAENEVGPDSWSSWQHWPAVFALTFAVLGNKTMHTIPAVRSRSLPHVVRLTPHLRWLYLSRMLVRLHRADLQITLASVMFLGMSSLCFRNLPFS